MILAVRRKSPRSFQKETLAAPGKPPALAKVMFFVWIVSMAKVVVDFDGLSSEPPPRLRLCGATNSSGLHLGLHHGTPKPRFDCHGKHARLALWVAPPTVRPHPKRKLNLSLGSFAILSGLFSFGRPRYDWSHATIRARQR